MEYSDKLTNRESEVLTLLLEDNSYKETAEKLNLSESTIKTYINSIFLKKQVNKLSQLILKEYKEKMESLSKEHSKILEQNKSLQYELRKVRG